MLNTDVIFPNTFHSQLVEFMDAECVHRKDNCIGFEKASAVKSSNEGKITDSPHLSHNGNLPHATRL
jgi:hypothetical protein